MAPPRPPAAPASAPASEGGPVPILRQLAGLAPRDFAEKTLTRLVSAVAPVAVYRLVRFTPGDSPADPLPPGFAIRFVEPDAAVALADLRDLHMSAEFAEHALAAGHRCLGIFEGDALAAMGWYAPHGSAAMVRGLAARLDDPAWVYMYHGVTRPAWRGRRLYPIGIRHALAHYAGEGRAGLVAAVEVANYESLRAVRHLGGDVYGSAYIAWRGGRPCIAHSPGAKRGPLKVAAADM